MPSTSGCSRGAPLPVTCPSLLAELTHSISLELVGFGTLGRLDCAVFRIDHSSLRKRMASFTRLSMLTLSLSLASMVVEGSLVLKNNGLSSALKSHVGGHVSPFLHGGFKGFSHYDPYLSASKSKIDHFLHESDSLGRRKLNVDVDYYNTPLEYLYLNQYHGFSHPLQGTELGFDVGLYDHLKNPYHVDGYKNKQYSTPNVYAPNAYGPSQQYAPNAYGPSQQYAPNAYGPSQQYAPNAYGPGQQYNPNVYGPNAYARGHQYNPNGYAADQQYGSDVYGPSQPGYAPQQRVYGPQDQGHEAPEVYNPGYDSQSQVYSNIQNNVYDSQNNGYEAQNSGYEAQNSGYEAQNSGYEAQNSGYEAQNSGYEAQNDAYGPQQQQGSGGQSQVYEPPKSSSSFVVNDHNPHQSYVPPSYEYLSPIPGRVPSSSSSKSNSDFANNEYTYGFSDFSKPSSSNPSS